MQIKTHLGVSVDGYISTPEGDRFCFRCRPFAGRTSHRLPGFLAGWRTALMGRRTFLPALDAPEWPWPGLRVFVLTSRPLELKSSRTFPDGCVEHVYTPSSV